VARYNKKKRVFLVWVALYKNKKIQGKYKKRKIQEKEKYKVAF
jgi:hypothetical protein